MTKLQLQHVTWNYLQPGWSQIGSNTLPNSDGPCSSIGGRAGYFEFFVVEVCEEEDKVRQPLSFWMSVS